MMLAPLRQGGSGAGSNSCAYRQQHVLHLIYRREAQGNPQAADKARAATGAAFQPLAHLLARSTGRPQAADQAREAQPSWHQAT